MRNLKKRILFLVNPISGGIKKEGFPALIEENLNTQKFDPAIWYWEDGEDAVEMTKKAISEGFECIVAVGGDGTINAVAAALIGSEVALGIIPMGSGNGLARHLGISMDTAKAIQNLNSASEKQMDMISLNGRYFANMAGTGFDAHIGQEFATAGSRGFSTYFKITLKELFSYKSQDYTLKINHTDLHFKAFLISFANGSQWGNNAMIAPDASCFDGEIDIAILQKFKWYQVPSLALSIFNGKIKNQKPVVHLKAKEFEVLRNTPAAVHLDGEPWIQPEKLHLKVLPAAIRIWI